MFPPFSYYVIRLWYLLPRTFNHRQESSLSDSCAIQKSLGCQQYWHVSGDSGSEVQESCGRQNLDLGRLNSCLVSWTRLDQVRTRVPSRNSCPICFHIPQSCFSPLRVLCSWEKFEIMNLLQNLASQDSPSPNSDFSQSPHSHPAKRISIQPILISVHNLSL